MNVRVIRIGVSDGRFNSNLREGLEWGKKATDVVAVAPGRLFRSTYLLCLEPTP